MQIDAHTSQESLQRLYSAVTRRELLMNSPLNIKLLLRYAVLFMLFPGMVFGFWVGMGTTLAFCVALTALLVLGLSASATLAVQCWFACGAAVFLWVCVWAVRSAWVLRRMREKPRPAEGAQAPGASAAVLKLRWHKGEQEDEWVTSLPWYAPASGIYAFLLNVQDMGRRRLLTQGRQGVCSVHTAGGGDALQTLLLFKLEAGQHTLRWSLTPRAGRPPTAELTWLNTHLK